MAVVFIAGAGRIGLGIAQMMAEGGHTAFLFDRENVLEKYEAYLEKLAVLEAKSRIPAGIRQAVEKYVVPVSDLGSASDAEIVFEAISENFQQKSDLFQKLDLVCGQEVVFGTATASLSIAALGTASGRTDRFLGTQFFAPVPVIDLAELTPSLNTSDQTLKMMRTFLTGLGRTCLVSRDTPGFTVNRQIVPTWNEAFCLMEEGVCAEDIDAAMRLVTEAPLGPLELADYVGLDMVLAVMRALHEVTCDEKYMPCPGLEALVEQGRLGRKCGWGVYRYERTA